ncbi:MAG: hypothetical protein JEY96_03035 [Bacteroidales bacterium]|nr:hypothetical protein [Bacteroidales bacterium]
MIDNAIKFTLNGYLFIVVDQINNFIQFAIQDTGIGIDPKIKSNIFKHFHQEEVEFTKNYDGVRCRFNNSKVFYRIIRW